MGINRLPQALNGFVLTQTLLISAFLMHAAQHTLNCKEASTREARKRYHVDDVQFHEVTVNGKHRKVDVTEKLASNSKLNLKYSPAPQPRIDPVKKAVQQLAKKELVTFAAAVRSRICPGKPNKQRDAPGFSQTVDKHIQKFQPYLQLTGVTAEKLKSDAIASYSSRNADAHPTDKQLQGLAEECCEYIDLMQELMPHECQLAMHFDWVRSHLFALS